MTYLIQLLTIVQREGRKLVLCRRLLQLLLAQVRPHLQLLGLGRWTMEKTTAWLLGTVHFDRNIGFWWKRKLRQAATSDFNQMTLKRPLKLNAHPHFQILRPAQSIQLQYFKSDQLHRTTLRQFVNRQLVKSLIWVSIGQVINTSCGFVK